jgi:hypothetical protein
MAAITRLKPSDTIQVDNMVIATMFKTHGAVVAEDMLMEYVETITDGIMALDGESKDAPGHAAKAHSVAQLAQEIGLTSLARTLHAVAQAAQDGNDAILPVLWERVKRIGDRSLVMLWELPQLRM